MRESERPVRSFVAVLLPERVRAALAAVGAALRGRTGGLAWVQPDNLHLTLRFLGGVEPGALPRVREAVATAAAAVAPFPIALGGLGGFPSGRPPRVLWAGVPTGAAGLEALHAALDTALAAQGFPAESRAFHAHVTLARARDPRGAGGLADALGAEPAFGEVCVTALHLMRSELDRRGARYSVLAEAPLGAPSGGRVDGRPQPIVYSSSVDIFGAPPLEWGRHGARQGGPGGPEGSRRGTEERDGGRQG